MPNRRKLAFALAGSLAGASLVARAQQDGRTWRVAFFYFGSRQSALSTGRFAAFVDGMRALGYVEGRNLHIDSRFGEADAERLPALAAELVQAKIDVVVASGSPVYRVLRDINLPVVVTVTADPVIDGIAASLARPGGNFTGLTDTAAVLGPKHLELLMSAVPRLTRIGALVNPDNGSHPKQLQGLTLAAQKFRVQVVKASAAAVADLATAFAAFARERVAAFMVFGDTFFTQELAAIAQGAVERRLPSVYLPIDYARIGGLMSYGPDFVDNFRRAASFVDKILKGAKPAELSFQQPTKYVFAVNLKTARAMGIALPQTLLLRADEVIE